MCNPAAYAVFQVASAVMSYKADDASAKATNERSANQAQTLRDNAIYSDNSLIRKKELEVQKASLNKFNTDIKAKQLLGTAKTKIGEKGIGGNVVDTLLGDIERQRGFAFNTIDTNYENYVRAIDTNREETNRNYVNQVLSLPTAYRPSILPYAIKAGGNIAGMYMSTQAPNTLFGNSQSFDGARSMTEYSLEPTAWSGSK
jgi:hypothetical protein